MKHLVLILLVIAFPFALSAQSTVLHSDEGTEEAGADLKVLVIPFHTLRYYFSDCDKEIAKTSKLDIKDVRKSFMLGLDYAQEARFEKRHAPLNLVQMRDSIDKEFMASVYDHVSYAFETPTRQLVRKQNGIVGRMKKKFKQIGQKEKPKTLNDQENYTTVDAEDNKYMKLFWEDADYLDQLATYYGPDVIVTINQFEIQTDYKKCIDRELGHYTRQIKVHYNVFLPNGKQIHGDVVTAKYNSKTDDINEIIQDNFGFLAEYIFQSLPKK